MKATRKGQLLKDGPSDAELGRRQLQLPAKDTAQPQMDPWDLGDFFGGAGYPMDMY